MLEAAELVDKLYFALLGRPAEPSGLVLWTDVIRSTGDPSVVFRGILESEEYKNHAKEADANPSSPYEDRLRLAPPPAFLSTDERITMTTSCKDTDAIPKVNGAGEVFIGPGNTACQRMHNGVIVAAGGYYGKWMTEVIRRLSGHHEPQEELLFHTAAPWIAPGDDQPVMVELGAFWSYYSLWFHSLYPNARNIMVEPDHENLRVGEKNFALNGFEGEFIQAAVGEHNASTQFRSESDGIVRPLRTVSVDGLAEDLHFKRIHLLHADVQGAEQVMLMGAEELIQQGRLDWLFLSTHHHSISGDPLTHQRCLAWLKEHGATVIEEHSVSESFSGDGLIVAKFGGGPPVPFPPISRNVPSRSLFRETEYDLADVEEQIRQFQGKLRYESHLKPVESQKYQGTTTRDCGAAVLADFESGWRYPERMAAVRQLVAAQARGELFPELPESSEPGYYFLHIPKTAGTSTNRFLDSLSPRLEAGLWDQLIERERAGAQAWAALISGHFHMHLEPFVGRSLKRFTILRDPMARTISHYLHVKRAPEHPYYEITQSLSLLEFCTHPKTRHMVENYQARYLVDFGIDPRVPGALCTKQELATFQLQDLLDRLTLDAVSDDLLLSAAEANLDTFAAVGITEKFSETMCRFAAVFGREDIPHAFDERHNVAPQRLPEASLDSKTRLAILGATQVDLALYRKVSSV